jgi:Insertion element 4 transposase N-terminal
VWRKLTAGLTGLALTAPSEKALRDLRRRLGPAPLKALFEVVAGPLAQPHTPGVCFAGLRTVAFDGLNSVKVPDTSRNRAWLGKIRHRLGLAGYPALRIMALAETGTRGLLGAAVGSVSDRDETGLARRLLHPGMLVLLDRGFDGAAFFSEITATGAMLLARAKSTRKPLVLVHLLAAMVLAAAWPSPQRGQCDMTAALLRLAVLHPGTGADGEFFQVVPFQRKITTSPPTLTVPTAQA